MAKWKGKVIGGGIGFMFGGPFGAILGTMAGDFFDRSAIVTRISGFENNGDEAVNSFSETDRSFIFTTHLVGTLMSVAKADGQVNRQEIKTIESTFIKLGFVGDDLSYIRNLINKLTYENINLQEMCRNYSSVADYNERLMLLRIVYLVAFADNVFHPSEDNIIKRIVEYLDINVNDALKIRSEFVKESKVRKSYNIFGISPNASKDEVERAYRDLSKKYHPDKVAHLGDEFTKLAHEKFQEINKAYEEIKMEKGF